MNSSSVSARRPESRIPGAARRRAWFAWALICVGLLGSVATAQESREPEPALAGPRVHTPAPVAPRDGAQAMDGTPGMRARTTGLFVALDGSINRAESTPEEAVLARMDLDETTRARVQGVLVARARLIDEFVRANIDLLTEIGTASETRNIPDLLWLGMETWEKTRPLRSRALLHEEIAAVLPAEERAPFQQALGDYWRTIIDSRGPKNMLERFGMLLEERLKVFGAQVEKSFQRLLRSGDLLFYYVSKDLDLSPAQRARLAEIIDEALSRGDVDDKMVQDRIGLGALSIMTPEQAAIVIKRFRGM